MIRWARCNHRLLKCGGGRQERSLPDAIKAIAGFENGRWPQDKGWGQLLENGKGKEIGFPQSL